MTINLLLPNQLVPNNKLSEFVIIFKAPELFRPNFSKVKVKYLNTCLTNYTKGIKNKVVVSSYGALKKVLATKKIQLLTTYVINDISIETNLKAICKIEQLESPMFLNSRERNKKLLTYKKIYFNSFYILQRKFHKVLMHCDRPIGGKWSFDNENRSPMPDSIASTLKDPAGVLFPTTREAALATLRAFIKNKLPHFGKYQDYVDSRHLLLYHSGLSAPLNVGLITPHDVLKAITETKATIPIQSLEGFIRQIIGWREYMCGLYQVHYTKMEKSNFFKHKNKIPRSFYTGTTGIVPLDNTIKRFKKYGYVHHIERLMIAGCLFLLCEIDPRQVLKWFTELSIDSYDWVMYPNVLIMSQYACGNFATTKPYFCASSYILKMSNYKKGPWCAVWDALFWRFLKKNKAFFKKQPRLSYITRYIDSKAKPTVVKLANSFIKKGKV